MHWYVYLVKCSDNTYYCGCTNDLEVRLQKHNFLRSGAKYTRSRRPVTLVYSEKLPTKSEALRREASIKKLSHGKKEVLINESTV